MRTLVVMHPYRKHTSDLHIFLDLRERHPVLVPNLSQSTLIIFLNDPPHRYDQVSHIYTSRQNAASMVAR